MTDKAFDLFMKHVYNTEDSLYQILYDKCYRPDVYKLKTNKSVVGTADTSKFGLEKEPGAINFVEMRFLEQINSTRIGLI